MEYPTVDSAGKPFERYAKAWKDYRCGHVVSKYAARIIQQFSASHLADSLEAAENGAAELSKREREPVDTSWHSITAVHNILQHTTSTERLKIGSDEQAKISKYAHQMESAKSISEKLWRISDNYDAGHGILNKEVSIAAQPSEDSSCKTDGTSPAAPSSTTQDTLLLYPSFRKNIADLWLRRLQADTSDEKPSAEQLQCIKTLVSRCID